MVDFHRVLIKLKDELGYNQTEKEKAETEKGVCASFADKGVEAFLLDDYRTFIERNRFIFENHESIPRRLKKVKKRVKKNAQKRGGLFYKKDILCPTDTLLFEIKSFFDQSDIYQNPRKYKNLLNKGVCIEELTLFSQSIKTLEAQGISKFMSFSGLYTVEELTLFFLIIDEATKMLNSRFCFNFFGVSHKFSLGYCPKEKSWTFIDVGDPFGPPILVDDFINALELATKLATTVFTKYREGKHAAFITQMVGLGEIQYEFAKFIAYLSENESLQKLHYPFPTKIGIITDRNENLPELIIYNDESSALIAMLDFVKNDVSLLTKNIELAILIAAKYNAIECMKILLDAEIFSPQLFFDINIKDENGDTALLIAAQYDLVEIATLLTNAKTVDGNPRIDFNLSLPTNETPALLAAREGHLSILQILLEKSARKDHCLVDFNKANQNGITPLFVAIQKTHLDVIDFLIHAQYPNGCFCVDLNVITDHAGTAIMRAVTQNNIDILKLILNAKTEQGVRRANPDITAQNDLTPLWKAAYMGNLDIVKILINAGADISLQYKKLSPIKIAEQQGHHHVAAWLSRYAVNIPKKSNSSFAFLSNIQKKNKKESKKVSKKNKKPTTL